MKTRYPLETKRVVDFGQGWAGPLVGTILADMGAQVIKVESRKRVDSQRLTPDNVERDPDKDPWFQTVNRNKLSITVDFGTDRGSSLLRRLVAISNVVIENFSPGVMKRHGLDYDSLKHIKDDIIMISMPGAGSYGPLSDIVTYGPSILGLSGYDCMVGYYGERVLGMQQAYADVNAALHGAFAVVAALRHFELTGEGQHIELAQWEAATSILGEAILGYVMNGRSLSTQGNRRNTWVPHNNYRCKGEDQWVSLSVRTETEWRNLCKAMGDPDWTKDDRFADAYERAKNEEELDRLISEWTASQTHYEVTAILQEAGVAATPCLDVEQRLFDAHFQERKAYTLVEHPALGTRWITSAPWKLSETPGGIIRRAPLLGEHNRYVLGELLGVEQCEIDGLVREKVVY